MPHVVKITHDDDGTKIDSPKWCYVIYTAGSEMSLCEGQVFGMGEGAAKYETKEGKITCPNCISIIKEIKSIKL